MEYVPNLDTTQKTYFISAHVASFWSNEITEEEVEMRKWLTDSPGGKYSLGGHGIYFYREEDAVYFALRWA
jgi:hypothetical protein